MVACLGPLNQCRSHLESAAQVQRFLSVYSLTHNLLGVARDRLKAITLGTPAYMSPEQALIFSNPPSSAREAGSPQNHIRGKY